MAKLADAPDLESGGLPCRFKSCHPHQICPRFHAGGKGIYFYEKIHDRMGRIFLAVPAAALYVINFPLSKILPDYMPTTLKAEFLYLGQARVCSSAPLIKKCRNNVHTENKLTKNELPYTPRLDSIGYRSALSACCSGQRHHRRKRRPFE